MNSREMYHPFTHFVLFSFVSLVIPPFVVVFDLNLNLNSNSLDSKVCNNIDTCISSNDLRTSGTNGLSLLLSNPNIQVREKERVVGVIYCTIIPIQQIVVGR